MPVIGITGGIATGKTSFCECVREFSQATIFNADVAARELADSDLEVRALLAENFGAGIFSDRGDLNRARLRAIVFADPEKKLALEQILHPRIRRQWSEQAEARRNSRELFLADIPLLYETSGESLCDFVAVIACSREVQLARLMQRMSLDRTPAEQMIQAQMPLAEKMRRADHVVWNNGPRAALAAQAQILANFWQTK